MSLHKICISFIILSILLYISSCIISDFEISTVNEDEIKRCFNTYVLSNRPNHIDIESRLIGTWKVEGTSIIFTDSLTYLQIDSNNTIWDFGKYNIEQHNLSYFLKTSNQNKLISGYINICETALYNASSNEIWIRD